MQVYNNRGYITKTLIFPLTMVFYLVHDVHKVFDVHDVRRRFDWNNINDNYR